MRKWKGETELRFNALPIVYLLHQALNRLLGPRLLAVVVIIALLRVSQQALDHGRRVKHIHFRRRSLLRMLATLDFTFRHFSHLSLAESREFKRFNLDTGFVDRT